MDVTDLISIKCWDFTAQDSTTQASAPSLDSLSLSITIFD